MLSTQTKILILFLSVENPLWNRIITPPVSLGKISGYLGVSLATIDNWKGGKHVDGRSIREALDATISRINSDSPATGKIGRSAESVTIGKVLDTTSREKAVSVVKGFAAVYDDLGHKAAVGSATSLVYEVALNLFELDIEKSQRIIDSVIYERFTILPYITYETLHEANAHFIRFAGVYHAWVARDDMWLQCSLRVRYVIGSKSRFLIRCKLNLPIIGREPYAIPYWEYDGFLRVRFDKVFWIFEKRDIEGSDLFNFITDRGHVHNPDDEAHFTLTGKYLTTGQGDRHPITAGDVVLRRILPHKPGSEFDETRMTQEMHSGATVIRDQREGDRIKKLLAELVITFPDNL